MSQEFDELARSNGRRSRKNPKLRGADDRSGTGNGQRREAVRQTSAGLSGSSDPRAASGLPLNEEAKIKRARRRRRIIAMIVAECFALMFIFGYAFMARKFSQIQRPEFNHAEVKNNDLDVDTVEKMKGYWTIAVFGVDARGKELDKFTNADVNMICNINMDSGEIRLVSVFRDTYLNIDDKGSYNKLNQAYFTGGPQQAVSALNRNLDLDVTHYVTFNWKAVADAINILGGIDVELTKAEYYYINSFITETVKATGVASKQLSHAGMNHLDGVQAVAYGRLRLMDTDYARTERQRRIIALAFEKAKQADIGVLNNIAEVVFEQVATNVELKDIIHMAMNISKYHLGETIGFPMARGDARMGKKGSVVVPQTLESNVAQLHQFLFGDEEYTTTATVKKISAKISEDSGMYKEGKYIDGVSTDNGVIQPPKKNTNETKKAQETEAEEGVGKSPTRESGGETDSSGNNIKQTDEYGNVLGETPGIIRPTDPGASTEATRPGGTMPSSGGRPGGTTETTAARPGGNETTAARPGGNETSASSPGGNETTAARPGNTETTASQPGATEPNTSGPGSTLPTSGNAGGNETTASSPGNTNETTISNNGPGSVTETTGVAPGNTGGPSGQNHEVPNISSPGA